MFNSPLLMLLCPRVESFGQCHFQILQILHHRYDQVIISRRLSGYQARYEFDEARDLVQVARIRHQRCAVFEHVHESYPERNAGVYG
ncbi:MAG: hypothetical protein K9K38_16700 [Rhodoferax sp.]|nr:hypothetical protein [Rhodoferax sp.]MCF8211019.1 hypothetical protein [Rhodoferax sp.]